MCYYFLYEFIHDGKILKLSIFPLGSIETFQNNLHVSLQLHFGVAGINSVKAQSNPGQNIKNIDSI